MSSGNLESIVMDVLMALAVGLLLSVQIKIAMATDKVLQKNLQTGQMVNVLDLNEQAEIVDVQPNGRIWVKFIVDNVVDWYTEEDLELLNVPQPVQPRKSDAGPPGDAKISTGGLGTSAGEV